MSGKRPDEDRRRGQWKRQRIDGGRRVDNRAENRVSRSRVPSQLLALRTSFGTSLTELKNKCTNWPWDKAPKGFEPFNLRALKLYGLATPTTDFSKQQLPADFEKFRQAKPLTNANSWALCVVNGQLLPSLEAAAKVMAESETAVRPSFVWNLAIEPTLLANRNTALTREKVDDGHLLGEWTAVKRDSRRLSPGEKWLYPPPPTENSEIIEVLNAVPFRKPVDVSEAMRALCTRLGYAPADVWISEGDANSPYKVTRVFIRLLNCRECRSLAEKLGNEKLDGRSLVAMVTQDDSK